MLRLSEYGIRFFKSKDGGLSYRRWRGGIQAGMVLYLEIFNEGGTLLSFENQGIKKIGCKIFQGAHLDDKCLLLPRTVISSPLATIETICLIVGMYGLRVEVESDETFAEKRIIALRFLKS